MAWTAVTSSQERSYGQWPRFPGKIPLEHPTVPLPRWKTHLRPGPVFGWKAPSRLGRGSLWSGKGSSFQRLPETVAVMAETFFWEFGAIRAWAMFKPAHPHKELLSSRQLGRRYRTNQSAACQRPFLPFLRQPQASRQNRKPPRRNPLHAVPCPNRLRPQLPVFLRRARMRRAA